MRFNGRIMTFTFTAIVEPNDRNIYHSQNRLKGQDKPICGIKNVWFLFVLISHLFQKYALQTKICLKIQKVCFSSFCNIHFFTNYSQTFVDFNFSLFFKKSHTYVKLLNASLPPSPSLSTLSLTHIHSPTLSLRLSLSHKSSLFLLHTYALSLLHTSSLTLSLSHIISLSLYVCLSECSSHMVRNRWGSSIRKVKFKTWRENENERGNLLWLAACLLIIGRDQFHQHFTPCFYMCRSQSAKKAVQSSSFLRFWDLQV